MLVKAAKETIRIIIRRPHAYIFRQSHPGATIPGLSVLDKNGRLLGSVKVPSLDAAKKVVDLLTAKK